MRRNKYDSMLQEAFESRGSSCEDCGIQGDKSLFDWHHIDPQKGDIRPSSYAGKKKELFLNEITKCILVCPNCHRVRHRGVKYGI